MKSVGRGGGLGSELEAVFDADFEEQLLDDLPGAAGAVAKVAVEGRVGGVLGLAASAVVLKREQTAHEGGEVVGAFAVEVGLHFAEASELVVAESSVWRALIARLVRPLGRGWFRGRSAGAGVGAERVDVADLLVEDGEAHGLLNHPRAGVEEVVEEPAGGEVEEDDDAGRRELREAILDFEGGALAHAL